MNRQKAKKLFEAAYAYSEQFHPEEIAWAKSTGKNKFRNLKSKAFLEQYCWVIYASGFKVSIVESVFPALGTAFKDFDLDRLSRTRSITRALHAFNNQRKAENFLGGCKIIASEGFRDFKRRVEKEGVVCLEQLPGIGPITKDHLAKNIGLADVAKRDIWLERAAKHCSATVDELVDFLSQEYKVTKHLADVVVWRYGADKGLGLRRESGSARTAATPG